MAVDLSDRCRQPSPPVRGRVQTILRYCRDSSQLGIQLFRSHPGQTRTGDTLQYPLSALDHPLLCERLHRFSYFAGTPEELLQLIKEYAPTNIRALVSAAPK